MKNRILAVTVCTIAAIALSGCSGEVAKSETTALSEIAAASETVASTVASTIAASESESYVLDPVIEEMNCNLLQESASISLNGSDTIGDVSSGYVAIIHLNAVGNYSPDSEITQISSSEIIVKDFNDSVIYQNAIDSTIIPHVVFDEENNLHVFLSDWGNTQHFAYDSNGELLSEMNYSLDFYVNTETVAFDRNGYFYAVNHEWPSGGSRKIQVFTPTGELLATKNQSRDIQTLIKVNGLIYMVYRNETNVNLIPVLEYVQNLDYEKITIENDGVGEITACVGGIYYVDISTGVSVVAYDLAEKTKTVVIENLDPYFTNIWSDGNSVIVACLDGSAVIYD